MKKCDICGLPIHATSEDKLCVSCQEIIVKIDFNLLDNERKYIEELFMSRYNNFLMVFSLIVTAGFATTLWNYRWMIFDFGTIILFLYWHTGLVRAYHKYDTLLKIFLSPVDIGGEPNPFYPIQQISKSRQHYHRGMRKYPVSKSMAILIPILCITFLLVMGILLHFNVID